MSRLSIAMERPGHEALRVAPIHRPKTRVKLGATSLDSLAHNSAENTASLRLSYYGGPLIQNVEVSIIYWGSKFKEEKWLSLPDRIDAFFDTILQSSVMDQMAEYSVKGMTIGRGRRVSSTIITSSVPKSHTTDSAIRAQLKKWIAAKNNIPQPNPNSLYFIYLEPGLSVSMGGAKSCSSFCGYHDAIGSNIYYSVMPFPSCSGCKGELDEFESLCGTSSHELCEAVTDPIPGTGWYHEEFGEVADICSWSFREEQGYIVQKEWSNKAARCL